MFFHKLNEMFISDRKPVFLLPRKSRVCGKPFSRRYLASSVNASGPRLKVNSSSSSKYPPFMRGFRKVDQRIYYDKITQNCIKKYLGNSRMLLLDLVLKRYFPLANFTKNATLRQQAMDTCAKVQFHQLLSTDIFPSFRIFRQM